MDTSELNIDVESLDQVESDYGDLELDGSPRDGTRSDPNLSPRSSEDQRLKVNSRERQRMHDLNSSLDALRQVRK
jgi:hypothetical protein